MLQYLSEVEVKLKQVDERAPERIIEQRNPSLVRNTSLLSRVITMGIEHTIKSVSNPWTVITAMECIVVDLLRFLKLSEPPLAEGKSRVRWHCVSLKGA